jgi:hypothetical protein
MNGFKTFEQEYKGISLFIRDSGEIITTDEAYSECSVNWAFADIIYSENSRKLRKLNTIFLKPALFERGYADEIERYNIRLQNSWITPGYKNLLGSSIGLILDRKNTIRFTGKISENLEKVIVKPSNQQNLNNLVIDSLFNAFQYGTSILILDFVTGLGSNEIQPVITSIPPKKILSIKYHETLSEKHVIDIIIKVTNETYIRFSKKSENNIKYIEKSEYTLIKNTNQLKLVAAEILVDENRNLLQSIPIFITNVTDNFNPLCRDNPFYWGYAEQTERLYNILSQHRGLISKFAAKYPFLTVEADLDNPTQPGEVDAATKMQQQLLGRSGHDSIAIMNRGDRVNALSPDMKILEIDWQEIVQAFQERDKAGISHLINEFNVTATGVATADRNQKSQIEIITDNQSSLWEQLFRSISEYFGEEPLESVRVGRDFSATEDRLTNFQIINDFFDRGLISQDEARQIIKSSKAFGDATNIFEPVDQVDAPYA